MLPSIYPINHSTHLTAIVGRAPPRGGCGAFPNPLLVRKQKLQVPQRQALGEFFFAENVGKPGFQQLPQFFDAYVGFNNAKTPLDNVKLRRALNGPGLLAVTPDADHEMLVTPVDEQVLMGFGLAEIEPFRAFANVAV